MTIVSLLGGRKMVRNTIDLDKDMDKCKELYEKLKQIVDAYEMLPVYEKIHSKTGNKLMNTSYSSNRQFEFAKMFNDLIIKYVEGSVPTEEEDEW
jgi:DNA polymerase II large subunit